MSAQIKYVIHKWSRNPASSSYSGPTWDNAGLRDRYKDVYTNKDEALELAKILGEYNPVGFEVSEAFKQ